MIKIEMTPQITNSFTPQGWALTDEPYKAYRAKNQDYYVTLNLGKDFDETKPSKLIKTKKGTILLVNCPEHEDEKIMLLTLRGGFRAGFDVMTFNGAEIIMGNTYSNKHCCPVQDLVVRFQNENSQVVLRTGNRTFFHFTKIVVVKWDKTFREDGYPLNELLPENEEVLELPLLKSLGKDKEALVAKVAEEGARMGFGVLVNFNCQYGKPKPELIVMKDADLENGQLVRFFDPYVNNFEEGVNRLKQISKYFAPKE